MMEWTWVHERTKRKMRKTPMHWPKVLMCRVDGDLSVADAAVAAYCVAEYAGAVHYEHHQDYHLRVEGMDASFPKAARLD